MSKKSLDAAAADLENLLHDIEGLSVYTDPKERDDHSHRLLGSLFRVVGKLNYLLRHELGSEEGKSSKSLEASVTGSSLLDGLDEWIQKIRQALSQLAKLLAAQTYTIGFAVPFGISLSITFTP